MKAHLQRRIDAALGRIECDLILRNVTYLDVFHCQWRTGDISCIDGTVVALEPGLKGKREINSQGKFLVPGFIDAHVHLESSLLTPENFQSAVLPKGTTTAIADPHELANVMGIEGIKYFLDAASSLHMDLRIMLSSCVPATHLETNGGGSINASDLLKLKDYAKALGLAEMMNVPGVLFKDDSVLDKILAFHDRPLDGHCPLVTGRELSAYASVGISSCHESSEIHEAHEKLSKGISVWIREGSVAKDLHTLVPLLTMATSTSVGFCTDDRNPYDIAHQGHLDFLLRESIRMGVPAEVVYRASSWSVARHYKLERIGAIAPGYVADFVVLDDAQTCSIAKVYKNAKPITEIPFQASSKKYANTIRAKVPECADLEGKTGRVHVIGILPGKIITESHVFDHDAPGVAKLTVLERYGKNSPPANGYVLGFGTHFHGAIASSVGHDSHNLIVAGSNTRDMRVALAALAESGGGFCVVNDGNVLAQLALPFGGLMTSASPAEVLSKLEALRKASHSVGCELAEPFLQLAFLSLPVIPHLKLTDKGLVDVNKFQIISVAAS